MVPASIKRKRSQEKQKSSQRQPSGTSRTSAANKSSASKTRNHTFNPSISNISSRGKAQYLTVKKGKAQSQLKPTKSLVKQRQLDRSNNSNTNLHLQQPLQDDAKTHYEKVTQHLQDSLNHFMSQDAGASTANINLDNSPNNFPIDMNYTAQTYFTNTDGSRTLINIQDNGEKMLKVPSTHTTNARGKNGSRGHELPG